MFLFIPLGQQLSLPGGMGQPCHAPLSPPLRRHSGNDRGLLVGFLACPLPPKCRTVPPSRRTGTVPNGSGKPLQNGLGEKTRETLVVAAWVIPVLIIAVAWGAGGVAGMLFQHAARVVGPSKSAYQVD